MENNRNRLASIGLWMVASCVCANSNAQESDSDQAHSREIPVEAPATMQTTYQGVVSSADAPKQTEEPIATAPLRGPRYLNLHYDEDWDYLDGEPGSYQPDSFDPIKNIHLGDEWRLSIGGDLRFRLESETNSAFGARRRTQDTFQLYRYLLHFDLKYDDTLRLFLQLGLMHEEDRDFPVRAIDENLGALHQLFLDIKPFGGESPLTLRVGRQELLYGKQRIISPLDWANTRRRFDAVKLIWEEKNWQLDAFWSRPIPVQRTQFDDWNDRVDFYGAYFTYRGWKQHGLDLFFLGLQDRGDRVNPNGRMGDVNRFTLGSRFWGKSGPWDYEALLAGQWGHWAGDNIEAWAWLVQGGYTFESVAWQPRIGAGVDWASGDDDPFDGSVETFDQLFPLGHAYLGYSDLFGRQNIQAVNVNVSAWPIPKKVRTYAALHTFWLQSREDALYNVAGIAGRRDPTGSSGRELGHELDLTLLWNLDVHQSVLLGYSHFWADNFIVNSGPDDDPGLFYVQYRYRF